MMELFSRARPVICASALLFGLLAACGGSSDGNPPPEDIATESSPTVSVVPPKTEVVSCEVEEGLPVAEVKVTNTTPSASKFDVTVQFLSGQTVSGEGLEFTSELEPGQNETVRMGNMQGDAPAVDECKVMSATPSE